MSLTSPSSPSEWIALLFERSGLQESALEQALGLPENVTVESVFSGTYNLSPTDLAAAADLLGVSVGVLTGRVPIERHFGVSLRLGNVVKAEVPTEALSYVDKVFDYRALLDSWLGQPSSPLADVNMSTDHYYIRAGKESAERVRDALDLGSIPIADLIDIVEGLGIPVISLVLPASVHGLNIRDEREGTPSRVVVVSTSDPWTRQRYTLAHELCHALYDDEDQLIIDRVDVPKVLPELRAESFARHLLLPAGSLRRDVEKERQQGVPWQVVVARLMIRWGISKAALMRALTDDGLASEDDLRSVTDLRIDQLMAMAGMSEQWNELSTGQNEQSGSPWMVERAVQAYGNGWVGLRVVADLLGKDVNTTRAELVRQGWS